MVGKIKVFQLNDCDWYAGATIKEAKECLMEATGMSADEAFEDEHQLSWQAMRRLKFFDEDGETEIGNFQEVLNKMVKDKCKFPCFFATTEF